MKWPFFMKKTEYNTLVLLSAVIVTWCVFALFLDGKSSIYNPFARSSKYYEEPIEMVLPRLLKHQRALIYQEFLFLRYHFHNFTHFDSQFNALMNNQVMELGGNPARNMIVSTWRCGSTFLAELVHDHPGNFYHYEPLLPFGIERIRSGSNVRVALDSLYNLFWCNYTTLRNYIEFGKQFPYLFYHNIPLWDVCHNSSLCEHKIFLSQFCQLFPYQTIKTVRLHLNLTAIFLKDKSLNMKIIYLVRDPRGTLESRKHRKWCPSNPECIDPSILCNDLVDEYYIAQNLLYEFPNYFRVMRYEDFSSSTLKASKEIYDFFQLKFTIKTESFLNIHTQVDWGGVSSTFRHSKTAPFNWRLKLNVSEVLEIEEHCHEALDLWGYKIFGAYNHLSLANFKPLKPNWSISPQKPSALQNFEIIQYMNNFTHHHNLIS